MSGVCYWFTGVVEDIHDPEEMNRVKVRLHGLHSDKLEVNVSEGKGMKTNELPWAYVAMPTTGSGMHGFGQSPHGLVEGSWVWGVSRDGQAYNELVVLAVLLGQPTKENPNSGGKKEAFFGMDGQWPDKEFLDEPDVNRLARGELGFKDERWKPVPEIKKEEKKTGIPKISGTWDEKDTPYAAEYPHNKILFDGYSRSLLEIDETPGSERISEWHGPSHTYREVHPDGSIQTRVTGDNYKIVQKDNNLYVEGEVNITVVGNANILSEEGDVNVESKTGKISLTSQQSIEIESAMGDIDIRAMTQNINLEAFTQNINLTSLVGGVNVTTAMNNITLNSGLGAIVLAGRSLVINSASVSGF